MASGDPQDAEVPVAVGHVDREAHAERVDRAGRSQQERAVDPVATEQRRGRRPAVLGHLQAGQHLVVAEQPGHRPYRSVAGHHTLKRISRTSPSPTS